MTRTSADYRAERQQIQAAVERLLAGTPRRSNGDLTVIQLANEAGVKRWKLTHRHIDLTREFQARACALDDKSPVVARWQERVDRLETANNQLRKEVDSLRVTVNCYAQLIHDLGTALEAQNDAGRQRLHPI